MFCGGGGSGDEAQRGRGALLLLLLLLSEQLGILSRVTEGEHTYPHIWTQYNWIMTDKEQGFVLFVPSSELKISFGLEETNCCVLGREDILDFFLRPEPRDLTVTSTGFWVVGLIKSLVSFLLFFTTNFFPFLSFITTFPILFDFAPNTPLSSDLRSLERLFPWRLSWRFWFRSFAIRSICKAETKKSCLKVVYNPSDSICMHPFNYVSRKHATTSEVPWFRISFLSTSKCIYI